MNLNKREIMAEARRALNNDEDMFIGITALPNGRTILKSTENDNVMNFAILTYQLMDCEVKMQGLESIIDTADLDFERVSTGVFNAIKTEVLRKVLNPHERN